MGPNTVEILLSINQSVKDIAKSMTPKNGDSAEATAKLSRGDVANTKDIKPAEGNGLKVDVSGASLGEIVKFLNMLSPSVTAIAKLSGGKMKNFTKVVDTILSSVKKMSDYAKANEDSIKNAMNIADSMNKFAEAIKKSSSLPVFSPLAFIGFTVAGSVVDAYIKILDRVGKMNSVRDKVRKLNEITKSVDDIMSFVMKGALLVGVCMGLGLLVSMGPTRQVILAGFAVLGAVLVTTTAIVLLTGLAAKVIKQTGSLRALKSVMNIVWMSTLLITVCLGLGYLVANTATVEILLSGLGVLGGTLLALTAIILLTGLASRVIKSSGAMSGVRQIILMTLAIMGVVVLSYAIGAAIDKLGGFEPILYGMAIMAGTMLLLAGMFWLIGMVAKQAINKDTVLGIAGLIILTFAAMGIIIAARKLGDMVIQNEEQVLVGLAATAGILLALVGIGYLAQNLLSGAKQGLIALAALELLALGAIGVTWVLVQLEKTKKDNNITWLDLMGDLLGVVSIIGVFGVLTAALSVVSAYIMAGVAAFAMIELLALGAIGIAFLLLKLRQVRTDAKISWLDLELELLGVAALIGTFGIMAAAFSVVAAPAILGAAALIPVEIMAAGAIGITHLLINLHNAAENAGVGFKQLEKDVFWMSTILGTFGLLAAAFGTIFPLVIAGSAALMPVEVMAAGVIGITALLIELHEKAVEHNVSFKQLEKDVLWMSAVMGTFGTLATAMSLLVIPIGLGTPGVLAVSGLALLIAGVIERLVHVSEAINKAGGSNKLKEILSKDIPAILKNINVKNFSMEIGRKKARELARDYDAISDIVSGVFTVAEGISKIALVTGVADVNGKIRPIISIDKHNGNITYGDPVDLVNTADIIAQTVTIFVNNLKFDMKNVQNLYDSKEIFTILANVIDPITRFTEMLMKYKDAGDGQLATISVDQDGKIKTGEPIKVADVAGAIAGAVSTFISALYSEENASQWSQMIYGDRTAWQRLWGKTGNKAKAMSEMSGLLGVVIDPICNFIETIANLDPVGGKLRRVYIDNEGNIKRGDPVDVAGSSQIISSLIGDFISSIFTNETIKSINDFDADHFEKLFKPVEEITKIAEKLSSDKISHDAIKMNGISIKDAFVSMVSSVNGVDASALAAGVSPLNEMVKIGTRLGRDIDGTKIATNTKSIVAFMTDVVEKKFPKNTENINKLTTSVKNLKTAFKDLDTVLIKEEDKRQKALDKFGESIKGIMGTLDGSQDSMGTFKDLLDRIQNLDLTRLETVTTANYQQVPQQQTVTNGNVAESTVNVNQNVVAPQPIASITKDDIISAINEVFSTLQIMPIANGVSDTTDIGNILITLGYNFSGASPS